MPCAEERFTYGQCRLPRRNSHESIQGQKACNGHGGRTGKLLGDDQAGGYIIVLGLHDDGKPIVGKLSVYRNARR